MEFDHEKLKREKGYQLCPDSLIFLKYFNPVPGSLILEVGANDEHVLNLLTDSGHKTLGIDLRKHLMDPQPNYPRIRGDFCEMAEKKMLEEFDAIYSTSAIEHFGLGTYPDSKIDPDYDFQAMDHMWDLLKPDGTCGITVPYGKKFVNDNRDWRVYDKAALQERIVRKFVVVDKVFFKSAGCGVTDVDGIVSEEDADQYCGDPPHLSVLLMMKKVA